MRNTYIPGCLLYDNVEIIPTPKTKTKLSLGLVIEVSEHWILALFEDGSLRHLSLFAGDTYSVVNI